MGYATFELQRKQQAEAAKKKPVEKTKEELKAEKKDQKQSTKHNSK